MRFLLAVIMLISSAAFAAVQNKDLKGFVQLKNGHKLFVDYKVAKKGMPTITFVNGLTFTTRDYALTAQFLTDQGYGILLYDTYGMGQTLLNNVFPSGPITVDSQITELDELMSNLGIQPPYNLFGLSYGGGIITAYAIKYPKNVKTLMMLSPYTEVLETSKQLILDQIAQTRILFPYNKATDEELANYFIRQYAYQTYPFAEPVVLENPYKLEGIVKLVQGITPYAPLDFISQVPDNTVHMMIGAADEYVKTESYDRFWKAMAPKAKCSYTVVEDTKHKITSVFPYFTARWINYVLQAGPAACTDAAYQVSPFLMDMKNRQTGASFRLPELKN